MQPKHLILTAGLAAALAMQGCASQRAEQPEVQASADTDLPGTLPDMSWRSVAENSDYAREVRRWIGDPNARARLIDPDEDGKPQAIMWYDAQDRLMQRWVDDNGDGRADQVLIYRDNKPVRLVRGDDATPRG